MKKIVNAITTIDNPYNPITQADLWRMYDINKGYNTCEYLARIARVSNDFTDEENDRNIDMAIDEILKYNPLGIYKKVSEIIEI